MSDGCDQDRRVKSCPTLKMKSSVFSKVYFEQNLDTNYSFLYLLSLIISERIGKKLLLGRSDLCIKVFSDQITFLIMMPFLDFRAQKNPFDLF